MFERSLWTASFLCKERVSMNVTKLVNNVLFSSQKLLRIFIYVAEDICYILRKTPEINPVSEKVTQSQPIV